MEGASDMPYGREHKPNGRSERVEEAGESFEESKLDTLRETSLHARISRPDSEINMQQPPFSKTDGRGKRSLHLGICVSLHTAAITGNWKLAKSILDENPGAVVMPITEIKQTLLHVAITAKHTTFALEVIKLTTGENLELTNCLGNTPFCTAALSGNVKVAAEMVKKNSKLPLLPDKKDRLPIHQAILWRHRDMVTYLLSVTPPEILKPSDREKLFHLTIKGEMYDIALEILGKDPQLATSTFDGKIALYHLASRPSAIASTNKMKVWKRFFNSWFEGIYNKALKETSAHQLVKDLWAEILKLPEDEFLKFVDQHFYIISHAAETGNVEFLTILIRSYPSLMWRTDKEKHDLFQISILNRQEKVFNLIYEIGGIKDIIPPTLDAKKNNMLHLVGGLAPPSRLNIVSGAALQMQRELLWFKEIEKIVPPSFLEKKNSELQTPRDLFSKTHKELQASGEKWMKDTANSCMLVATLITTVVFAAAFTIPGGNNDTGTPIFLGNDWFLVFFISNAIALLSSSTSILIFLSILTSRYMEEDFFKSLPGRLVLGLTTLFISIVGMVAAFSSTCLLVYQEKTTRLPIVIIASAGVPIIIFVFLHYELWIDIIRSTYWSRYLFRPRKHKLF